MIPVTRPVVPPFEEYVGMLAGVWGRVHFTNDGPLVQRLERELSAFLGLRHVVFVANGTLALQLALRGAQVRGDVITTPFSYVATVSSIVWEGCRPVFADVNPATLMLDPEQVIRAITPATTAILATHVYGLSCDVDALARVAEQHRLVLLYDAAHSFGSRTHGRAQASFGDAATLSFHATKLFHTGEGGAVVTDNDMIAARVRAMRSFGQQGADGATLGINAKNTELHAALGLVQIPGIGRVLAARRGIVAAYDAALAGSPVEHVRRDARDEWNAAYYPVLLPRGMPADAVRAWMLAHGVETRRYFSPALHQLSYVDSGPMPAAEDAAARVLCLPLYPQLTSDDVARVVSCFRGALEACGAGAMADGPR